MCWICKELPSLPSKPGSGRPETPTSFLPSAPFMQEKTQDEDPRAVRPWLKAGTLETDCLGFLQFCLFLAVWPLARPSPSLCLSFPVYEMEITATCCPVREYRAPRIERMSPFPATRGENEARGWQETA